MPGQTFGCSSGMLAEWCNGEQQAKSDVSLSKTHTKTRLVHMAFEDYNWLGWMLPFSVSRVSVGCCCSAHAYWSAFNSLLPAVQVNTLVSIPGSLIGLRTISGSNIGFNYPIKQGGGGDEERNKSISFCFSPCSVHTVMKHKMVSCLHEQDSYKSFFFYN